MRRQSSFFLATLLVALVCPAHADDAAVRKELDADYTTFESSFKKKDLKDLLNLLTPDFTMTMNGKKEDRKLFERALQVQVNQVDRMLIKIQSLKVTDDTAVATLQIDMVGTMTIDKKAHKLVASDSSKHTWTKTAQGWRLKSEEILKTDYLMDGKPFNPPKGVPQK